MVKSKELAQKILDLLKTLQAASVELHHAIQLKNNEAAKALLEDMRLAIESVLREAPTLSDEEPSIALQKIGDSIHSSLLCIEEFLIDKPIYAMNKVEFEILPLVQEAFVNLYFFGLVYPDEKLMQRYYKKEMLSFNANPYIDDALKTGKYKYEVSIAVRAFNNLEYTKRCIENLLKWIPSNLNYELILINHGSTDGTKEYFESLNPTKQLDIKINGGGVGAVSRIVEGEYYLQISNDVVVTENVIENLIRCIRSDDKIGWAVPTTSNVSNLQAIPADYSSMEELFQFAKMNNTSDSFRFEQRVRLCNPIDIRRSSIFYSSQGLGLNGYFISSGDLDFPDDKISLLLRRNKYKSVLVKNAYCHHFGSVTIKNEVNKENEQSFYLNGRKTFLSAFGVDPWGTGFCYDPILIEKLSFEHKGHVDVLGVNCGLGSNPLKIKENYKEMQHNLDVSICNITDRKAYLVDLKGVSECSYHVISQAKMKMVISKRKYHYIVWEDEFVDKSWNKETIFNYLASLLHPEGMLAIRAKTYQTLKMADLKESKAVSWILIHK